MNSPEAPRGAILEANLRALFARAYQPVPIRAGFAEEVRRAAGAALASAPRARPAWGRAVLAAAASFLLAWLAFAAYQRSDGARDRILSRGEVALRQGGGAWHAAGSTGESRLALGEQALELALPAGQVALVACERGALALEGPAAARLARSGLSTDVDARRGKASLRGFHGRVRGAFGSFECAGADLDLEGTEGDCIDALLTAGRARFESPAGLRSDLPLARRFPTCPPEVGAERAIPPFGMAEPVRGPARTAVASPAEEPRPAAAAAAVTGSVRDADGKPATAFQVVLLREVELPRTAEPKSHPFTDPAGRFSIEKLGQGLWTIYVQAAGHALWTREHVAVQGETVVLDVRLERGASLAGVVVDAKSGAPLPGVIVISENDVPGKLLEFGTAELPGNPAALVRTGSDGRFELANLAPRKTMLRAVQPGFGAEWSAALVPGAAADVRIEMSPGGALAGRIEREDGTPWAGAAVIAMPQRTLVDLPRHSFGLGMSGADGSYRLDDLPPGEYVAVRVEPSRPDGSIPGRPAGSSPRTEVRQASIEREVVRRLDFLAPLRGSRLVGRVLHPDGTPMAAATISILPDDHGSTSVSGVPAAWRSQLCAADGAFEFTDVRPGRYDVFLGVRSPMDIVHVDAIEVSASATTTCEVRAAAGQLFGRVLRASDDAPLMSAVIVIEREWDQGVCEFVAKIFCDDTGAWSAPFLADGTYRVRVYPGRGLGFAGRDGVEVRGSAPGPSLDFELEPGTTLMLVVRDDVGAPVPGLEVQLFDARERPYQPGEHLLTDSAGRCRLDGLPAGRTRVLVQRSQGGTSIETFVLAEPPAALALELTWPAGK